MAAPGDIPELLREGVGGNWVETPGQAMATELGWPGPLHLVTAGNWVSPCHGEQLHVVEVRAVVEQSWHLGVGLESTQCFSCSLRVSSFFSICFPHLDLLLLFLLFLSSSSSSPLGQLSPVFSSPPLGLHAVFSHHLSSLQFVTTAPISGRGGGHSSLSSPQPATALPTARVDVPGV